MDRTKARYGEVTQEYTNALESYLREGNEAALHRVYEFGRRCLAEGRSILDMVLIHHEALGAVWHAAPSQLPPEVLRRAGEFFTECMSPFEMTHRAFGEANRALRHLNETLEGQARLIARELHDQSSQLLAAVHIELDETALQLPAEGRVRLQGIKELLGEVEAQLRNISHELRPTILDDLGLTAALESLSHRISKRTKVRIDIGSFNGDRLPSHIEIALYRIIQEALNNVIKHAQATTVKIRLRRNKRAVVCTIQDNGQGFDPKSLATDLPTRGLGLLGIQERLQALQGEMQIESGQGTRLKITIPVEG